MDAIRGTTPFIAHPDGLGWLYAPSGPRRRAAPAHYEPHESPVAQPALRAERQPDCASASTTATNPYNPRRRPGAEVFPYVITTYRLTEHHTAGGMSRTLPVPRGAAAGDVLSRSAPQLAAERGLEHGGWATIVTARAAIEARVLVTDRLRPLRVTAASCTRSACPTTGAAGPGHRRRRQRAALAGARPQHPHLRVQGADLRHRARPAAARPRARGVRRRLPPAGGSGRRLMPDAALEVRDLRRRGAAARRLLHRHDALHRLQGVRGRLQGVEPRPGRPRAASPATRTTTRSHSAPTPGATSRSSSSASRSTARRGRSSRPRGRAPRRRAGLETHQDGDGLRWLMASDVCKHCTHAACLDVCPTGALFRTEFGTVVVQQDVCNGCGYCVPGLPVRRARPARGRRPGLEMHALLRPPQGRPEPACAQACPTNSIQFGELDDLRERAEERLETAARGGPERGAPLPRRPRRRRRRLRRVLPAARRARDLPAAARPRRHDARPRPIWAAAGAAAAALGGAVAAAVLWRRGMSAAGRRGRRRSRAPTTAGPIIKPPVWTPEIPAYFFVGGLAGASRGRPAC